jgi:hypothetical protein
MRTTARVCGFRVLATLLLLATAGVMRAATYAPMSDTDLAAGSPVIVHARVVDQSIRIELLNGVEHPFTITTLAAIEKIKGSVPDVFQVRLSGGVVGDLAWWLPGTPSFSLAQEVVLFLSRREGTVENEFSPTEFGLSKFDLVQDSAGRQFAVRPVFSPASDDQVSRRVPATASTGASPASSRASLRDAASFLCALRAVAQGQDAQTIVYAAPEGALRASGGASPLWVNIGGPEPGSCGGTPCLFRWFWDTGDSPDAVVSVIGTQTNLSDGSNGTPHVQNAVDKWHGVAASDVHLSGIASSGVSVARAESASAGNVSVILDAPSSQDGGASWTTPFGCAGGILGLGGPGPSSGPRTYKGDTTYFAPATATVSMRKSTCSTGYPAAVFRTSVLHETGHALGLGHPDQGTSTHSTTSASDWAKAVMHSTIPPGTPDTPQTDDIQAIQYYYPGSGGVPCTPDATTFCANGNRFKVQVQWTSPSSTAPATERVFAATASGAGQAVALTSDTGYFWFFSANNVEMVVKVVDGRAVNGKFWVFAGGLTNVNVVITVTDTVTGTVKTYVNPQGTAFAPIQDTGAFATTPEVSVRTPGGEEGVAAAATVISADLTRLIEDRASAESALTAKPLSTDACTVNATTLCLNSGRFQVRVSWATTDGRSGAGQAVGLTGDTGYFWFFSSNNVEMVIKVVDGRVVNGKFWVFAGGLTNVNAVITVTDTVTGAVKTYVNPQGTAFAPIQDTGAF